MFAMSKSVFIWGSCVSRDILRVTGKFELTGYVGRQSLVSGMNPGLKDPGPTRLEHAFQDRSLRGDFRSNGRQRIAEKVPNTDAFIIDLATERRGVYPAREGYLSRTAELAKSRLLPQYRTGRAIEFGTLRHRKLFTAAAHTLYSELEKYGMEQRVAVINHPFSSETLNGHQLGPSLGKSSEEWNKLFPIYYEILSDLGFTIFDPPPSELIKTADDHAWGRTVDHYLDETYYFWADQIDNFIDSLGTDEQDTLRGDGNSPSV